jgi:hypothetical protein
VPERLLTPFLDDPFSTALAGQTDQSAAGGVAPTHAGTCACQRPASSDEDESAVLKWLLTVSH